MTIRHRWWPWLALAAGGVTASISVIGTQSADAGTMRYEAGTYVLRSTLIVPDRTALVGAGPGQTIFVAAPGFAGPMISTANPSSTAHHPGITIRGITVDGALTAKRGIYLRAADDLTMAEVEAKNTTGNAIEHRGTLDTPLTQRQTWHNVTVHDCGGWGVYNGLRTRHVHYADIKVDHCRNGMTVDHSESQLTGVQMTDNSVDGLWIRNVFGLSVIGVRVSGNGRYGVHVQGMVESTGSAWLAQNNGTADVWFDGATPPDFNYGITRKTVINGLSVGYNEFVWPSGTTEIPLLLDAGVDVDLTGVNTTTGAAINRS